MPDRPSHLWRSLPADRRLAAAEAFWRDADGDAPLQQAEALLAIAKRLNFRPKSVRALPVDRRARHLVNLPDIPDGVASRALIAYHFAAQRPLMAAFLDALGIAHENGLIAEADVAPPPGDRLASAVATLRASFPEEDVALYLRTLTALDGDTWAGLDEAVRGPKAVV
jgi:hypothetical protein